jgi:1,4-dihydroxy-6-naphthoate synthase
MPLGHQQLPPAARAADRKVLRVAYTPDSDDAFNHYAWEHGRVGLAGWTASFHRDHIVALNRAAWDEQYDVVGVSSVQYPSLADRYWILSVGNSIGRGYGPVLVSKHYGSIEALRGKHVAVAGLGTTGAALCAMFCKGACFSEMPYNQIADGVAAGRFDAGVMIHEELLYFPEKGLSKVCDLGAMWCEATDRPLPVGLNLVRKAVGRATAREIVRVCHRSLEWGHAHFDEAFAFASRFGRGCGAQHIAMFSNQDTLCLAADAREGLSIMFDRVAQLGLGPKLETFEIIDEN